ncbi:hypothetical protein KM043_005418 [Ampulex compressa]|nr:hypothetical protein KM043_005418 [Ampulex compressa]
MPERMSASRRANLRIIPDVYTDSRWIICTAGDSRIAAVRARGEKSADLENMISTRNGRALSRPNFVRTVSFVDL